MTQPAPFVICARCGGENPQPDDEEVAPGCLGCGAPLRVLEPMVVDCGWCQAHNQRDQTAHCHRCGGPLPALPGGEPGARPPEVPRVLPKGYRWRVLLWKNVMAFIGMMFSTVFVWSVIFPIIGIPLWYFGHRKGKRWLHALINGRATRGRLTSVALDYSQTHNNKHPWRIEYSFDRHEGGEGQGFCEAWDPINGDRSVGDAVWVVYATDEGGHLASAIWPPLR